jgi:uncharacterized protein involved in exopolysaccharide biosynthesis
MNFTLQDLLAVAFRQKRFIGIVFGCTFGLIGLALFLQPDLYDAEMKIMVRQSRVDPIVTADPQSPYRTIGALTEQDLSSEAELLKSRDILEGAAVECKLPKPKPNGWAWVPVVNAFAASSPAKPEYDLVTLSEAVRNLDTGIQASTSKNSNLISVSYPSTNPTLAACVLKSISKLYLEKHLAVHSPGHAFEFFKTETDRYKGDLESVETQLAQFGQREFLVTDGIEKEMTVRKLGDFTAALLDTKTNIAAAQARLHSLENLAHSTQQRQTKAVRTSPNAALQGLQTQLVTLELKRTELKGKFNSDYRPLQDLEKQIQELKDTIAEVVKVPFVEETTDANPANDWLNVELVKAWAELASLQASAPVKQQAVSEYRSMALDIAQKDIRRTDLVRRQKVTEEKYLLYLRKQEEARIEQELDRQRIVNVAIAQDPEIPILPEPSLMPVKLGLAGVFAFLLSFGGAMGVDYHDRTFRNSTEVAKYLALPVLGSIPLSGDDQAYRDASAL